MCSSRVNDFFQRLHFLRKVTILFKLALQVDVLEDGLALTALVAVFVEGPSEGVEVTELALLAVLIGLSVQLDVVG